MKLFDGSQYTRLDDDVSFQILRTNPKLTTNTKLMYDGENLYMESYQATPLLSTMKYKHHKVWKTGLFNNDIKNFLLGSGSSAYAVGQNMPNTIISDDYDDQFETMYWCGVEAINSKAYSQEFGIVAPLYIRKKLPNYFVIFKLDYNLNKINSLNSNLSTNSFHILKSFNLKEGTPIGDYIRKYVEQRDFKYDRSIYVNFSSKRIYYYGIDKQTGVLAEKVEGISEQMLENDNTIMKSDDWITSGFERNNLIFPYIINLEFLFDDVETNEYEFGRYFGIYCNDIDIYSAKAVEVENEELSHNTKFPFVGTIKYPNGLLSIGDINGNTNNFAIGSMKNPTLLMGPDVIDIKNIKPQNKIEIQFEGDENKIKLNENLFNYIKDKDDNIYSIKQSSNSGLLNLKSSTFSISTTEDIGNFIGFEKKSISAYCERINGYGRAFMAVRVKKRFNNDSQVSIYNDGFHVATVYGSDKVSAGKSHKDKFSVNGSIEQQVKAIVGAFSNIIEDKIAVWQSNDIFVIMSIYTGTTHNYKYDVIVDNTSQSLERIEKLNTFCGGTDIDGCLFKIYTEDIDLFKSSLNDRVRYISAGNKKNNAILLDVTPYINDYREIDNEYSMLITDSAGANVDVSNTNQVEVLDEFMTKIGMLSFFPVKDFDFDTVSSSYGMSECINNELNKFDKILESVGRGSDNVQATIDVKINTEETNEDLFNIVTEIEKFDDNNKNFTSRIGNILYARFFYDNGISLDNEYDYFSENIIPEMCTVNKSTPFISKWGYADDSKDSCENNYRLNFSKIFGGCNFSANTFSNSNILEYTHSMPYYVIRQNQMTVEPENETEKNYNRDEYQYVIVDDEMLEYNNMGWNGFVSKWITKFKSHDEDYFEKMFGDKSNTIFDNKRFNKKYSRFLFGNGNITSSTLFRGVKMDIADIIGGNEVSSGKYNGYRFSFIYIPIDTPIKTTYEIKGDKPEGTKDIEGIPIIPSDEPFKPEEILVYESVINEFSNTVYFVKNEKFKFIVGMMFFPTLSDEVIDDLKYGDQLEYAKFNKSYVYGACMGLNIKK